MCIEVVHIKLCMYDCVYNECACVIVRTKCAHVNRCIVEVKQVLYLGEVSIVSWCNLPKAY